MCFGNLEFQDAILHRQNNRFYTRMSLISLLCGFAKEQILSKPEYLFFVLSSKKKSRLSKCIWGKRWKVWKSHHSAFTHLLKSNTQTQGLVDSLLQDQKQASELLPHQPQKQHCRATANSLIIDGFSGILLIQVSGYHSLSWCACLKDLIFFNLTVKSYGLQPFQCLPQKRGILR